MIGKFFPMVGKLPRRGGTPHPRKGGRKEGVFHGREDGGKQEKMSAFSIISKVFWPWGGRGAGEEIRSPA
jgi:hypothetical protein